jgi:hypothetical protein
VGFESYGTDLPEDVSEEALLKVVQDYNADPAVHGILVQVWGGGQGAGGRGQGAGGRGQGAGGRGWGWGRGQGPIRSCTAQDAAGQQTPACTAGSSARGCMGPVHLASSLKTDGHTAYSMESEPITPYTVWEASPHPTHTHTHTSAPLPLPSLFLFR